MKKILSLIISITLLFLVACSDNPTSGNEIEVIETGDNYTFIKSAERAELTGNNRSEEISDPFEIVDVRIDNVNDKKLMIIDVIQISGCEEAHPEKFEVIWDGIMLMIYPPQVAFYLTFNSGVCSELEENVKETIVLDLHEHFGDFDDNAQYTVINASKSYDTNDIKINR